ncbi:hypothetical protein [Azohydromonas aeria]|uniref:hypothetical protein n=1 Tax=Azohydromonas aeria TaxID=2590212 RepID=UPI0012F8790F|nr:hypothetical protein [Azohydromonas aeria]
MNHLKTLRLACLMSGAGVIAAVLSGCASNAATQQTAATGGTPMQATTTAAAPATGVSPQVSGSGTLSAADVRDWSQVDTNRDNLVSPEEMEAYLKANPYTPKR